MREPFTSHGEVQSVRVLGARHCAFITFASRHDAEAAADALHNALMVRGQRAKLMWGRPHGQPADAQPPPSIPPFTPSQVRHPCLRWQCRLRQACQARCLACLHHIRGAGATQCGDASSG